MKKIMKVLISMILVVIMSFGFAACGADNGVTPTPPDVQPDDKIELVKKDGGFQYTLVIPQNASEAEIYASEEFQNFGGQATNSTIRVVRDNEVTYNNSDKYISIGKTNLLPKAAGVEVDNAKLYTDGFIIDTDKNMIFITGAQDRGTLYGVYDFLERFLGVEFLAVDCTYIPEIAELKVAFPRVEEIPQFWGRDSHQYSVIVNADFAARMRMNGVRTPTTAKHGYGTKQEWSQQWAHTFFALLPPKTYAKAHEDWYSNASDALADKHAQLCLTNVDARNELIKNLKQWIIDQPQAKYFAVAQEDNSKTCKCGECQKSDKNYTKSGTLMRFINTVAGEIKTWADVEFPGREIYIETFAYQHTSGAPVKNIDGKIQPIDASVVAPDNVVIRVAPIWNCYSHELGDENCTVNISFGQSMEGWSMICDKLMVWQYCSNFQNYMLPFWNFNTLQANYQMYAQYGVIDMLDQGAHNTPRTEMQELEIYLHSKLMWNPYQDINALIDNFFEKYYGVASSYVKEYFELMNNHFAILDKDGKFHVRLYAENPAMLAASTYPRQLLEKAMGCFDKGLEAVQNVSDLDERAVLVERLTAASLAPRYLVMHNYDKYYSMSTGRDFVLDFFNDCATVGITRIKEMAALDSSKDFYLGKY